MWFMLRIESLSETPTQFIDTGERSSRSVFLRKSSKSASKTSSSSHKSQGKITRKDLRLHKLVFEDNFLPDETEVGYYKEDSVWLQDGFCNFLFVLQDRSAHHSLKNMLVSLVVGSITSINGASLHELSLNLSRTHKFSTDKNDDLCSTCQDAGDLLFCDGCSRAFHIECISLPSIPKGKWYYKYCEDMLQKGKFAERNCNAVAAGLVPGVDPIDQITNCCIRIVKTLDTQDGICCVLCRAQNICTSGFGPRTVILCDQCEKEYHMRCLREHKMHYLKELPEGATFL